MSAELFYTAVVERRKKWDVVFAVSYMAVTGADLKAMGLAGKSTGLTRAKADQLASQVEAFRETQETGKVSKRKAVKGSKDPGLKKSEKTSLLPTRKSR